MENEVVDWASFDNDVSPELLDNVAQLENGSMEYEEIPEGTYEVVPEKILMKLSKKQNPMSVVWLKIVNGEKKGRIIFANFVMNKPIGIHKAKEFLHSMDVEFTTGFESYTQWAGALAIEHDCICGKYSYVMEYGKDQKGYNTYKITQGPFAVPDDYEYRE